MLTKGPASFLKHASDVALFYGFKPMQDIERALENRTNLPAGRRKRIPLYSFPSAAQVAAAHAAARPGEPVLGFYATPAPMYTPAAYPAREVGEFGLQVLGTHESVGEVVVIKTVAMIANEWGLKVTRVRLNALGDRDSQHRFERELSIHARKHAGRFESDCKDAAMKDPFAMYRCTKQACHDIASEAPRAVHFLSEKSRAHFRTVLEHVEQLGLAYELDDMLVGDERAPHLAFALDFEDVDATLVGAFGGRFDEYLRRETHRKDSAGVGASLFFRKKGVTTSACQPSSRSYKPKVYFAQLGLKAKLQGLTVVDMLRAARVPVLQSFDTAHLGTQLASARELGVSHLLIMGQREALDGTLIVRSMQNSAQTTLQLSEIPRFLKTLR
jgi:histidyl-tRNA synthetase